MADEVTTTWTVGEYSPEQQRILLAGGPLFDLRLRRIRLVNGSLADNVVTLTGGDSHEVLDAVERTV